MAYAVRDVNAQANHRSITAAVGKIAHFIRGGDISAGGVMHAVTSVAQTLDDADAAFDLESNAVQAMRLAAAHA